MITSLVRELKAVYGGVYLQIFSQKAAYRENGEAFVNLFLAAKG
jgi:hypothetical protein